jgi:hypothetical protein
MRIRRFRRNFLRFLAISAVVSALFAIPFGIATTALANPIPSNDPPKKSGKDAGDKSLQADRGERESQKSDHDIRGRIVDRETDEAIPNAVVTMQFLFKEGDRNTVASARAVSDERGRFHTLVSYARTATDKSVVISVGKRNYLNTYKSVYESTLKDQTFENAIADRTERIVLEKGAEISGRFLGENDSSPGPIKVECRLNHADANENRDFSRTDFTTWSDLDGYFHLLIPKSGDLTIQSHPNRFAPFSRTFRDDRRGDLGVFHLERGVRIVGTVVDDEGKPVAGVLVHPSHSPDEDFISFQEDVVVTDRQGSFTSLPIAAGVYYLAVAPNTTVVPSTVVAQLPAAYVPLKTIVRRDETEHRVTIRPVPSVVVSGKFTFPDKSGDNSNRLNVSIFGNLSGSIWNAHPGVFPDGSFKVRIPHGIQNASLMILYNMHSNIKYRTDGQKAYRYLSLPNIELGTLDKDVRDLDIVVSPAPDLIVKVRTVDDLVPKSLDLFAEYSVQSKIPTQFDIPIKSGYHLDGFEKIGAGRYRSRFRIFEDTDLVLKASAQDYEPASQTVNLKAGEKREIEFVLEKKKRP